MSSRARPSLDPERHPSAARAAVPAAVLDPVPRRVQRQSVQTGGGAVRHLSALFRTRRRSFSSARSRRRCSSCPSSCSRRSSGQLADDHDKARLIRIIKTAEIGIMIVGGAGLAARQHLRSMLAAVFAMGVHSTFFGPIKYAILPQHLRQGRSARRHRAGRGRHLYRDPRSGRSSPASLSGRPPRRGRRRWLRRARLFSPGARCPRRRRRPSASRSIWHIIRASIELVSATMHIPRLFLAILVDQLLLDDRRGADHHLPAAGEERARRQRAGRQPVHRHLLGRDRDRLGRDQPAAEERGLGAHSRPAR